MQIYTQIRQFTYIYNDEKKNNRIFRTFIFVFYWLKTQKQRRTGV